MGTASFRDEDVLSAEWFLKPWIARGIYTLIVGLPSCGKSSFGAFLASQAKRTIMFPGEEDIRRVVLPRLRARGIPLDRVLFAPSGENWTFPRHRDKLIRLIQHEGADLVLVDPLDSYCEGATDENQNLPVRRLLDTFSRAAEETGVAVVIVRHPGKARENLLAGSRAFRSHPRAILQMALLPKDRSKGIIEPYKAPLGHWTPPHFYRLEGLDNEPKEFRFESEAPWERSQEAAQPMDDMERSKIDEAEWLLKRWLADGAEMSAAELYKLAEQQRLSDRILRYAAMRLQVRKRHEGSREATVCYWKLPPKDEKMGTF